jgi:hypothetical protein
VAKAQTKTDETDAKRPVFTPRTTFQLKLKWPAIYPGKEFVFTLRMQLVEDAEKVNMEFIMLPDVDKTQDRRHQMDARMLGLLSTEPPSGFDDFPELPDGTNLAEAIYGYLYPDPGERRDGMRFIARQAMARYWAAVSPDEYL